MWLAVHQLRVDLLTGGCLTLNQLRLVIFQRACLIRTTPLLIREGEVHLVDFHTDCKVFIQSSGREGLVCLLRLPIVRLLRAVWPNQASFILCGQLSQDFLLR